MAEYVISDGLALVKPYTGDTTDAVTSTAGYVDLSEKALTMTLETTRQIAAVNPHGGGRDRLSRQLPGARTGQIVLTFLRDDGGAIDPYRVLREIDSAGGKLSFVIQLDRASLTAQNGDVTPAASHANPQYAGALAISRLEHWGQGDGNAPAIVALTGTLDRDFNVYP